MGFDNVHRLSTTGRWKMKGDGVKPAGVCDVCTRANLKRSTLKKKSKFPHKSTTINELIFTDLKGPIEVPTFGGNRYVLIFVDDYSNYVHTYFLKTKDEALYQFKIHHTFVQTQHGHKVQHLIKAINSDGGGEFNSNAWIQFCQDKGIKRRVTTAHTPEMNGKAEVRFRTMFERVRAMLMDQNLPKQCWGFAAEYSTLIMNISPSSKRTQTPYEMWNKKKFDYDTLRTFGCIGYAHVTKSHKKDMHETDPDNTMRQTLDNRGTCGIFVGRSDIRKAWKFLNCRTVKVFESCHVVFNEEITPETLRIKREELTSLQQLTQLDFDYNSKYANIPVDLIFYREHPQEEEALLSSLRLYQMEALLDIMDSGPQVLTSESSVPTTKDLQHLVKVENDAAKSEIVEASTNAVLIEPKSCEEAMNSPQKIHWIEAMKKEGKSLKEHGTWTLEQLPIGKEALTARWIFKIKYDANGNIERYKARLVIRGFEQVKHIDFEEIFAPVLRMDALRILLALVALHDLECHQMDVDTAFLNGDLEEEVYMYQPKGLEENGKEHLVCKLNKALYGLKQAPRAWYKKLTNHLIKYGFTKVLVDSCIWIKHIKGDICIIGIYVDDLLLISKSTETLRKMKKMLTSEFKCKDLGEVHYLLR
jgi:histone deacetylase 1/2